MSDVCGEAVKVDGGFSNNIRDIKSPQTSKKTPDYLATLDTKRVALIHDPCRHVWNWDEKEADK